MVQNFVLLLLLLLTLLLNPHQMCAVNWSPEQGPPKWILMQQNFVLQLLTRHAASQTTDRNPCPCCPTIGSTIRRQTFRLHHPVSIRVDVDKGWVKVDLIASHLNIPDATY